MTGDAIHRRRLVLVGGGHAHAQVLERWIRDPMPHVDLWVVSPDAKSPYSGMVPGWLAGLYDYDDICIDIAGLCADAGATFVQDEMIDLDAVRRRVHLRSGTSIDYDVLSLDVGSTLHPPTVADATVLPLRPLSRLRQRWDALLVDLASDRTDAPITITGVGGGAAGFESARRAAPTALRSTAGAASRSARPPTRSCPASHAVRYDARPACWPNATSRCGPATRSTRSRCGRRRTLRRPLRRARRPISRPHPVTWSCGPPAHDRTRGNRPPRSRPIPTAASSSTVTCARPRIPTCTPAATAPRGHDRCRRPGSMPCAWDPCWSHNLRAALVGDRGRGTPTRLSAAASPSCAAVDRGSLCDRVARRVLVLRRLGLALEGLARSPLPRPLRHSPSVPSHPAPRPPKSPP